MKTSAIEAKNSMLRIDRDADTRLERGPLFSCPWGNPGIAIKLNPGTTVTAELPANAGPGG